MSIDLSKFEGLTELLEGVKDYESVILSEKTLTYKN